MQMTWIMFERNLPYVQWRDTPKGYRVTCHPVATILIGTTPP